MMRGPEFAGRPHRAGRAGPPRRRHGRVHLPRRRARRTRASTSRPPARSCSRSATRARPSRSASGARPCASRVRRRSRCRASAGARSARSRATARDRRCPPTSDTLANEHLRVEVDPDDGTLTIEADGVRVAGADRSSTVATAATPTTTHRPTVDTIVDRAESVPSTVDGTRSGARPARRDRDLPRWPHTRSATNGRAPPQRRDRHPPRSSPRSSCAPASASCACTSSSTTACRDHRLRAHFPLPAPGRAAPTPSVRSRSCTAVSPPRAGRTSSGCRRSCPAGSSTPPRTTAADDVGARAPPRRPARVRGGRRRPRARAHAAARHRLPLALRALAAPQPGRSARPARGPAAPTAPGGRLRGAPPPRRLARRRAPRGRRRVPRPARTVRGGGWPGATGPATGAALAVDGAEVSALLRDDRGALTLRVVNLSPEPSVVTVARDGDPVAGNVVELTGTALGPFGGRAELRPWEILTLRLDGWSGDEHEHAGEVGAATTTAG